MEKFMKKVWLAVALVCAAWMPTLAQSPNTQYETGKIVAVTKLPAAHANNSGGAADAPVASEVDDYKISIQVGDTVYVCRYTSHSDQDLSWIQGKEAEVRIKGKTMYVKRATGKEAQAGIVSKSKAPAL
jgi:hypothetical protein